MNKERIAELRIEALNAKYAGKDFAIPASEAMEILNLAMNQLEPRVTPEMWKELGRIEAERTTAPVSLTDEKIIEAIDRPGFAWENLDAAEQRNLLGSIRALLAAAPAPIQQAITYPPDGTVSPFTVINLGHGQVKMGDCVHDERLPALWFGKDGLGMGVEQVMNRAAAEGETLAVVTFSNVEGLDVLAEVVQRIRRISFPDAATPPALAGSQVQAAGDARKRVARAIWNLRREDEDRCDMELEDMGDQHSVWAEADAAIAAMREQP